MTANLTLNIPGSFCYDNLDENCRRYGRLYTWKSAKQGCPLLGEGWRLPSIDEWWQLSVKETGMSGDSTIVRKAAFKVLLYNGGAGFDALLGGGRDQAGSYARGEAHGFYWTATETDTSTAFYSNFAKGSQALYQQREGEMDRAFSVRCVKDNK